MEMLSNALELIALFAMAAWFAAPSLRTAVLTARAPRRDQRSGPEGPDPFDDPCAGGR
jgi:hypothetical protein